MATALVTQIAYAVRSLFDPAGTAGRLIGLGKLANYGLLPSFTPAYLFAAGVDGVWYDPSDFSTMFQDAAGTTPVTAVGQPVGRILDKFGRGNHAYNPSGNSANFPVLSARYNYIQNSATPWTQTRSGYTGLTLTATGAYGPDGATSVYKSVLSSTGAESYCYSAVDLTVPANTAVKFSQLVRTTASDYQYVLVKGALAWSNRYAVLFNASTGAFVRAYTAGTVADTSYYATNFGNGWWQFSITFSTSIASTPEWGCLPSPTDTPALDPSLDLTTRGDGVKAVYLGGTDVRVANDALNQPDYQRVNTATNYDTVGFKPYLSFNGVNQWLQTNSIDFTYGDKMFVCAGVRKLSDAAAGILVEIGQGTGSNRFYVTAPLSAGNFSFNTKATTDTEYAATGFSAPVSNVLSCAYDMAASTLSSAVNPRVNAAVPTLAIIANGPPGTGNYGNYPLYIGARAGTSLWFNGRLYGLVVAGKAASAREIGSTGAWLNQKTGAY